MLLMSGIPDIESPPPPTGVDAIDCVPNKEPKPPTEPEP